jgi:hypothetical protein
MDDVRLIDDGTLDRLLSGRMDADDAPQALVGVAELVSALAAPATASELAGQGRAVAAASVILAGPAPTLGPARRTTSRGRAGSRFIKTKVASLAFAGTLLGTTGLAAAGVLPDPIQDAAHQILSTVGIDVPSASDDREPGAGGEDGERPAATTDADVSGNEQRHPGGTIDPGSEGDNDAPDNENHGNGNPPDDPGNANPPDDPGHGNGNPPDDPGNANPPDDPGHGNGNPPDDPGNGNPPDDPGNGNGNPPDDPGNGNPPDDPGNGNGNPPDDPGNGNPPDDPGNGNGNPPPTT